VTTYSVQTPDGREMGTIDDETWQVSHPGLQGLADCRKRNGRPLQGYDNGYVRFVPVAMTSRPLTARPGDLAWDYGTPPGRKSQPPAQPSGGTGAAAARRAERIRRRKGRA
jgi:hypothetical protein